MASVSQFSDLTRYELQSLMLDEGTRLSPHQILARKKILERVGGVKNARRLVELLAKVSDGRVRWRIDEAV